MKKIIVKVKPSKKHIEIVSVRDNELIINLTAPAHDNKANKQLIKVLAKYFKTKPNNLVINSGQKTRKKILLWDN